eukprot:3609922-Pyramimonas_sp.AAC.1
MYQQMREAAQSTRRGGIDLPSANWAPPLEYVPDPNPSLDIPNRHECVQAFFQPADMRSDSCRAPYSTTDGLPVAS